MPLRPLFAMVVFAAGVVSGIAPAFGQLTIPTVPIGSPGNAPDPLTARRYGSVAYTYNIGATEVTNAQYAAFLSAVAAADPNALYNSAMAGAFGGITRAGSPGSWTYATIPGRENNPVNYVSFWDATRFANWLHNGQPTGPQNASTTEGGAYTLSGGTVFSNTVTRNAGWLWAVTSENEWYKAAYCQPAAQGGDADDYWFYPTSSNTFSADQANFIGGVANTTPAGTYAPNFAGAFDMGGNVWEWNETISSNFTRRGIRGGSFSDPEIYLWSNNPLAARPSTESEAIGFRVSSIPGPSAAALLLLGAAAAIHRRRSIGAHSSSAPREYNEQPPQ